MRVNSEEKNDRLNVTKAVLQQKRCQTQSYETVQDPVLR